MNHSYGQYQLIFDDLLNLLELPLFPLRSPNQTFIKNNIYTYQQSIQRKHYQYYQQ